ncbi:MAG: 4-(cytidine 5'-diphospho)-2-C-methyl-D-erythritol kinase, partial [Actinomycetota bacterium]|nr:4-(cytidine 5'-diphospho)-2-C-methyl-D-erythritol kinase [Actinomycetota bacterium]
MPAPVVLAPAKLTCSLRVTGRRPDGYHEIDAEMLTLDLADELTFTDGDHLEVVGSSGLAVSEGDDNLVRRALTVLGRKAAVRLVKRIPAGAG